MNRITNEVLAERIGYIKETVDDFRKETNTNFKGMCHQVKKNTGFRLKMVGAFKFIGLLALVATIVGVFVIAFK